MTAAPAADRVHRVYTGLFPRGSKMIRFGKCSCDSGLVLWGEDAIAAHRALAGHAGLLR